MEKEEKNVKGPTKLGASYSNENFKMVKIGPAGSGGGETTFEDCNGHLREFFISYGKIIHSVQFLYSDIDDGTYIYSPVYGQPIGENFECGKIDMSSLTGLSGSYNNTHITSLTFFSNGKTYGPYGCKCSNDKVFNYHMGDHFRGFYGSFDVTGLTSIGVFFKPPAAIDEDEHF